jgi:hypothetical protein
LLALRDWVFETQKGTIWTFRSQQYGPLSGKTKFLEDLCTIEPDFEIVSDIANASKHMVLDTGRRLTELYGAANVHVQSHGGSGLLGFNALGGGAIGSVPTQTIFVQIGTAFHPVVEPANKVHGVWKELFAENSW